MRVFTWQALVRQEQQ